MSKFYCGFRRFCAVLVGLVFFVAGLLKLMDPVGASLVMEEYFKFFHCEFFQPLAGLAGVGMALLETMVGVALLAGVWKKIVALVTCAMMAFFTILTLVLVIFNPPMDCGCFGEAIHLTHLQTFLKNVVLCALCVGAFIPFGKDPAPRKSKYVAFALATAVVLGFTVYSAYNLPLVDFTPFKPGTQILAASQDPESPVLSLRDEYGDYCDETAAYGKVIVFSAYRPEKLSEEDWNALSAAVFDSFGAGINPMLLLASADLQAVPLELKQFAYMSDFRTVVALNRSNGGATLLEDGNIVKKWTRKASPSAEEMMELSQTDTQELTVKETSRGRIWFQGIGLFCVAVLLLL